MDMEKILKKLKEFFKDKVKDISIGDNKKHFSDGYYCVESNKEKVCIRNDLFVLFVFTEGSKWGEELFEFLFGKKDIKTEVYEELNTEESRYVYDIKLEDQIYERGIIIFTGEEKKREEDYFTNKSVNLPVVLRIFQTEIPLSDFEKIGETSEFILNNGDSLKVELLLNGKVIGEGRLYLNDNEYKLKITNIYKG